MWKPGSLTAMSSCIVLMVRERFGDQLSFSIIPSDDRSQRHASETGPMIGEG